METGIYFTGTYITRFKQTQIMTAREFFYLVSDMRDAQKRYFESRDRMVFRAARLLENTVDSEIRRVKAILEKEGGPTS